MNLQSTSHPLHPRHLDTPAVTIDDRNCGTAPRQYDYRGFRTTTKIGNTSQGTITINFGESKWLFLSIFTMVVYEPVGNQYLMGESPVLAFYW